MAALEKLFEAARRKDERLSVELAYDQPHLVSVQVAPDWLEANDRVVRHKGVKVPVPCLRTVLLYLLYKTAACFERTRAPARSLQHEQVRTQRLDDALSILYVFSRLVRPRTTAAGVRKAPLLFLEWDYQAWMADFDRHLRRDPEHESRYESVLDLLSDASFSQLGLRRWAASFVASTKDSAQGVAGVSEPSVHERASLIAGQMLAFLERVRDMILSPFEPAVRPRCSGFFSSAGAHHPAFQSRTARTDDKP
ncbi:hypothetical protein DMC30DRAFT_400149 [Rhodotorula diobovata]|uniref:Uncharacterized protein n=1 Tax=Rhodotorula diobovata TaxID=5288 RepID=A0A5C5FTI1_9BASI|nr:hypothetical protein DMC30DRAFT_400149 [Rhodotorula diobovata]